MVRHDDDLAARRHLKVFVGGLPSDASERAVADHFGRYGHTVNVSVVGPKEGEAKKSPYAFITYKFAADADAAVVDIQNFPGTGRPLAMGFASARRKEGDPKVALCESDPCKVFVGGISDRDSEEEVGDFFSQWGLVALIYRDRGNWGFVHFAAKEAALRLLEEPSVQFQRRKLDIKKASDSKRTQSDEERNELVRRAVARHFHKKSMALVPLGPPPAFPGYPAYPAPGYYGYTPPPGGYPPPGYPGYPGYPPPPGPGYYPPGPGGFYPPPPGSAPLPLSDRPAAGPEYRDPYAPGGFYARPPAGEEAAGYAPAPPAFPGDPYGRPQYDPRFAPY